MQLRIRQKFNIRPSDIPVKGVLAFAGDTELNDYMDSLARDPNKFITPHNADTGETILHLLAKEGKMEILQNLLEDSRVERDLVRALLKQAS